MRLRHIEVFSAIMKTGSAVGAARVLNISQPAVSKMLQHAERTLGFALFVRSKGKLVPTPEALRLQEELQPLDDQLARVHRVVANLSAGKEAPLRIAATSSLAHHLVPYALADWGRAFPNAQCMLVSSLTREMIYWLLIGEIDMGFTMQAISQPNLVTTPVCNFDLYVIAPPDWWPKRVLDRPAVPADLAGQPFIALDTASPLGVTVMGWLDGVEPEIKASVKTYALARALVEANVGIAVVDGFTAQAGASAGKVQMRPIASPTENWVYALTNSSRPPPQSADVLIRSMQALGGYSSLARQKES
ncbi:LysR family transcriptional regulator [Paraburkholderia kururiensis]|uniref:LysR family transcriptional regulator n=1 Tax=Paraburkholderia kururiensis TaxID=984307 RepID=UPI0003450B82|nr:LysR family transcriptional regulator [Paraburkholderia kururiensis]